MKVTLPKSVRDSLPAPDSQGLVRVTATLRVNPEGKAELIELNDSPIGGDDDNPMPEEDLPDLDRVVDDIYKT